MARPSAPARLAGVLPALPLLAGAALLVAAEPVRLRELRVAGRVVSTQSAGAHHGWALALLAVAMVALSAVAVLRETPLPALGALALALVALWVVLGIDRPALDDTTLVAGRLARAHGGPAFRIELVGAVLAVLGALGVTLATAGARRG
jgi:hypothetical protein